MSHRLVLTFLLGFVLASVLGAIMQGGGGVVSTVLAEDITANSTVIYATPSTDLFADKDTITIDSENILYSSKNETCFVVNTRGYDDTTPADHNAGTRIYSEEAGVINNALGFNVAVEAETGGTIGLIMLPINFFTRTIPHAIMLNVSFLKIPELAFIGIIWTVCGVVLLVYLAVLIAPIAISAATAIVGLIRR